MALEALRPTAPKEYYFESLRIIESTSKEETAYVAGDFIASLIYEKPDAVITFATGATMEPVLRALVATGVDAQNIQAQHLDEYVGADPEKDEESFVKFLRDRAFNPLKIQNRFEINGIANDLETEAARYEQLVSSRPADLVILGIGPGGHIAFNEIGTSFELGVHVQKLSPETVERDVQRGQTRREFAYTQGPKNIIDGKNIMVVLYGQQKGEWLSQCLMGPISEEFPASILRLPHIAHKVTIFLDELAGNAIRSPRLRII